LKEYAKRSENGIISAIKNQKVKFQQEAKSYCGFESVAQFPPEQFPEAHPIENIPMNTKYPPINTPSHSRLIVV